MGGSICNQPSCCDCARMGVLQGPMRALGQLEKHHKGADRDAQPEPNGTGSRDLGLGGLLSAEPAVMDAQGCKHRCGPIKCLRRGWVQASGRGSRHERRRRRSSAGEQRWARRRASPELHGVDAASRRHAQQAMHGSRPHHTSPIAPPIITSPSFIHRLHAHSLAVAPPAADLQIKPASSGCIERTAAANANLQPAHDQNGKQGGACWVRRRAYHPAIVHNNPPPCSGSQRRRPMQNRDSRSHEAADFCVASTHAHLGARRQGHLASNIYIQCVIAGSTLGLLGTRVETPVSIPLLRAEPNRRTAACSPSLNHRRRRRPRSLCVTLPIHRRRNHQLNSCQALHRWR